MNAPDGSSSQATAIPSRSPVERARHIKSGREYEVITRGALVQTDTPLTDYAEVVVYQGGDYIWVRPVTEFDDGRFEPLPPTLAAPIPSEETESTEALIARLEHELGVKGINSVFRKALAMAKEAAADAKLPKGLVVAVSGEVIREIDGLNKAPLAPHAAAPHVPGPGYRVIRAGALAGEAGTAETAGDAP